jgi:hypothetical protein
VQQLDLFNSEAFRDRRPQPAARLVAAVLWVQLDLLSPEWLNRQEPEEVDDDPFVAAPVVHRVVLALEAEPPQTTGIPSVFDPAFVVLSKPTRPPRPEEPQPRYGVTTREVGVVRHTARRYDETEEWAEKERQRRARQRVPKPTKRARTRGRKLLELIGQEETEQ